jgi:hypothetical protein
MGLFSIFWLEARSMAGNAEQTTGQRSEPLGPDYFL